MARSLKVVGIILLVLVMLVIAGVIVVTQLIDPNDFKPRIQALAEQNANLDLQIEGDLSWAFWPSLGVEAGRTEARIAGSDDIFAAFDHATVGVAIWPLLFGDIRMDEVILNGLEMNLVQLPEGANWERIGPQDASPQEAAPAPEQPTGEEGLSELSLFVPALEVRDARIRYRAPADDTDILVEHVNLLATDISLDEPFDVDASFRYQDQADIRIDSSISATLSADLERNIFRAAPLAVSAEVGGLTAQPIAVEISGENLEAALEEDRASVRNLVLEIAGVRTRVGADIEQLTSNPVIRGEIETEPFDPNIALRNLGMAPVATSDPSALKKVSFKATIAGEPGSVMLEPMTLQVDDSSVQGKAGITDLDTMAIAFDLSLDRLALDGYLPPEVEVETSEDAPASDTAGIAPSPAPGSGILPALSEEPLLPLDTLRTLALDGRFTAGEVSLDEIVASDLVFEVSAQAGKLALNQASGKLAGGTFKADSSLDASQDQPLIAFNADIQGLNLRPLVKYGLGQEVLSGAADTSLRFRTRGNSEKALVANASGMLDFGMDNAILHGISLHNILIGGLNDMLGSVSGLTALIPGQDSKKLPRELREDTRLMGLTGRARLEKEVAWIDNLSARLDDGELTGEGYLNLRSEEFELQLGIRSEQFTDNKYFANRAWPILCRGDLQGNPATWCGPDMQAFREMGKDIAKDAAKQKLKEELGVQGDESVSDAAKKKAREELKDRARDELKKLFQ